MEQDEDYLLGSLAKINESIKSRDKKLFLENITNFYQNNLKDYNDKNIKKIKELKEKKNFLKNNKKELREEDEYNKFCRSVSFQSIQNLDVNFNNLENKLDIFSFNSLFSTHSSKFLEKSSINFFNNDPILSQNIMHAEKNVKILMIGEEKVGKSYFINKFLKNEQVKDYIHTDSLEISKKIITLVNKCVKLEIYDTNVEILNSQLFKSKIIFF